MWIKSQDRGTICQNNFAGVDQAANDIFYRFQKTALQAFKQTK